MKKLSKPLILASLTACTLPFASVNADILDRVPHILVKPIAMQLGDFTLTTTGVLELGTNYSRASAINTYGAFVDANLSADIRRKFVNGWTAGAYGTARSGATTASTAGTSISSLNDASYNAAAFVSGPWGMFEAGYLDKISFAVKGSSAQTGFAGLKFDGVSGDVEVDEWAARFTTNYGPHSALMAIDRRLNAKLGYFFKRPIQAFNYTAGVEALYGNDTATSIAGFGQAQTFGVQGGLQVDYGRLFLSGGAGLEHLRAKTSSATDNRLFASLGASNKFGRLTASVGTSLSYHTKSKALNSELALGGELALSRGITLLAGYNLIYSRTAATATSAALDSFENAAKLGIRFAF